MSRPQSRGFVRPGTGQRNMMASSSGRPGTNRLATPGQTAGYGVSLNTEVNVADRPVTQQGMMGMRIATAGPGRQVQDASYFMGRLHQKTADITSELQRLNEEIERDAKDKTQYSQLDRKYEALLKEVRELECQLADHNLATDNLRSSADPADIVEAQIQLKNRNQKEAEEVDRIFIIRQEKESGVHMLEGEMHDIQRQQEARINELAPMKLENYRNLVHQNAELEHELGPRIQEIDMMVQQIRQKEEMLASDRYRDEYMKLNRQIERLRIDRDAAQEDANTCKMDPEEARTMMLEKVKEGKLKMSNIEEQIKEKNETKKQLLKNIDEIQNDIQERQSENDNGSGNATQNKYEMLRQRDAEMTTFLDDFEAKRQHAMADQLETQNTIVKLLEHISSGLQREVNMPDPTKLKEMEDDLSFKERQLESSQTTKERLEQELSKRQQELAKINSLEDKISVELAALKEKMVTMTDDMFRFQQMDELRDTAEQTKQTLLRYKQKYIRRRDAVKTQVQCVSQQLEDLKHRLQENETAKTLDSLEQKLRHYEQNIFHLKTYIDSKNREVNYDVLKEECLRLVEDANATLMKQQASNIHIGAAY